MTGHDVLKGIRIAEGAKVALRAYDPADTLGLGEKADVVAQTAKRAERLAELGAMLAATRSHALVVLVQGMDAAGKDGTVKHCLGTLNPMEMKVTAFKAPTSTELAHDFLWRVHAALPERGQIGIFNRSHYEDVLVVRVSELAPKAVWSKRYDAINSFERHLANEGTTIVKLFLNISRAEQAKRFRDRLSDRTKNWKFSAADLEKRSQWPAYMRAYRAVLERTSTALAPWHVVPADHAWVRNAVVTEALVDALEAMDLSWPRLDPAVRKTKIV